MIIISEHYGCHWLYPLKVIQQISAFIEELINYSSTNYEAITRQNALTKLIAFQLINDTVLKNLVNANHHMCSFLNLGETAFGPW
jgi:c-di-AMP phosphodiesterase-like protein